MSTDNTPAEWLAANSTRYRAELGRVRRMLIGVTSRVLWQLIGHRGLDNKLETREAEVFGGAGMIARPGGRNAEAIVVFTGEGASSPMIVAIRDQQMAAALATALTGGELGTGEVAIGAGVEGEVAGLTHWKADGTIEHRSQAGAAVSLATKADLQRVITAIDAAITTLGGALAAPELAALKAALLALIPAWPAGTSVLKGE